MREGGIRANCDIWSETGPRKRDWHHLHLNHMSRRALRQVSGAGDQHGPSIVSSELHNHSSRRFGGARACWYACPRSHSGSGCECIGGGAPGRGNAHFPDARPCSGAGSWVTHKPLGGHPGSEWPDGCSPRGHDDRSTHRRAGKRHRCSRRRSWRCWKWAVEQHPTPQK
jgi:hypothetical protein